MQTRYGRITNNEREEISRSLATGKTITEIATELGRHRTTIFREIKRNCGKSGYRAFSASRRAQASVQRVGCGYLPQHHRGSRTTVKWVENSPMPEF
jgi:IS30 family transposase